MLKSKPVVMTLSGHDPSGGAGIQADIEAIHAQGCHATTVITCLTVQDTRNVYQLESVPAELVWRQAIRILNDMPIQAFKIGLIGSEQLLEVIEKILRLAPDIPVVLDPVLTAGGGKKLSKNTLEQAICDTLLPLATVILPNIPEAQQLSKKQHMGDAAHYFYQQGCDYSLITGTHSSHNAVINTLYHKGRKLSELSWPRLPHTYHGSGCTLASSLAGLIASGQPMGEAVRLSQQYTWDSLQQATSQSRGQWIPNR